MQNLTNGRRPQNEEGQTQDTMMGRTDRAWELHGCGVRQRKGALVLFCVLTPPLFKLTAPPFSFESTAPTCQLSVVSVGLSPIGSRLLRPRQ